MREPRHYLFLVACGGMLVFGSILALPGTVIGLPDFTERLNLSLADRGAFIAALFGGLLVGSVLSGPVVDHAGYRWSIAGSAAALGILLPAFSFASSARSALLALGAIGLTSAALNTASNALSSELFPDERGRRMNVVALAVSTGGLLLPTAIALAAPALSWRAAVLGAAVLSMVVAVACLRIHSPAAVALESPVRALQSFVVQPGFLRMCVLAACGAANEATFAGWTSSYLVANGFRPVVATWVLSSHWLGLLLGRFVFAGRVDRSKAAAVVYGGLAGASVLALLVAAPVPPVLAAGPFIGGLAIAVILPTALALAGERHRGNAGTLFGLLLTMAQVGAMTVPPLIGMLADAVSLRWALILAVVNSVLIAVLARERDRRSPVKTFEPHS